MKTAEFSCWRW